MFDILNSSSTRIKTGLALITAFCLVGFLDIYFITWIALGIIMLFSLYEAMELFGLDDDKIYLVAGLLWIVAGFYPKPEDLIFVAGVIFASILAYTKNFNKQLFIPLMYPMVSLLFLLSLYTSFGMSYLFWLVVVVSGTDIGAYFVGKSIGSTEFCATSPNKTLEGVAGGIAVASLLGLIFSPSDIGFFASLIISILVAISSIFGDLFESYLKREANVKDSGDILPGHGGMLDRSDGYLFGAIIMLVLLRMFA